MGWGCTVLRSTAGDRDAEAESTVLSGRMIREGDGRRKGVLERTGQGIQPPLSLSAPVSWPGSGTISALAVGCLSVLTFAVGGYVRVESLGPDEGMREGEDICGGGGVYCLEGRRSECAVPMLLYLAIR